MIEALATTLSRGDQYSQAFFDMVLTAIVIKHLRTKSSLDIKVVGRQVARNKSTGLSHRPAARSPRSVVNRLRIRPKILGLISFPHHASIPNRLRRPQANLPLS